MVATGAWHLAQSLLQWAGVCCLPRRLLRRTPAATGACSFWLGPPAGAGWSGEDVSRVAEQVHWVHERQVPSGPTFLR